MKPVLGMLFRPESKGDASGLAANRTKECGGAESLGCVNVEETGSRAPCICWETEECQPGSVRPHCHKILRPGLEWPP